MLSQGPIFHRVANDFWAQEGSQYPINGVVKIRVEKAFPVLSPAFTFNPGVKEEDVKAIWLKRYGYRETE